MLFLCCGFPLGVFAKKDNGKKRIEKKERLPSGQKHISKDLFGVFFEDLSYSADGGLYAELVQNRSFEYSPSEKDHWNPNKN